MVKLYIFSLCRTAFLFAVSAAYAFVDHVIDQAVNAYRYVLREVAIVAAAYVWRAVALPAVVCFRVIETLKPIYRESFQTFGLSLLRRREAFPLMA